LRRAVQSEDTKKRLWLLETSTIELDTMFSADKEDPFISELLKLVHRLLSGNVNDIFSSNPTPIAYAEVELMLLDFSQEPLLKSRKFPGKRFSEDEDHCFCKLDTEKPSRLALL
jgi:hypothetical protein